MSGHPHGELRNWTDDQLRSEIERLETKGADGTHVNISVAEADRLVFARHLLLWRGEEAEDDALQGYTAWKIL